MIDYQRYGVLIDTKFTHGLSPDETQELQQLTARLEAVDASTYAPVLQALRHSLPDQPRAPKPQRRHPNRRKARHERQQLSRRKER